VAHVPRRRHLDLFGHRLDGFTDHSSPISVRRSQFADFSSPISVRRSLFADFTLLISVCRFQCADLSSPISVRRSQFADLSSFVHFPEYLKTFLITYLLLNWKLTLPPTVNHTSHKIRHPPWAILVTNLEQKFTRRDLSYRPSFISYFLHSTH